MFNAMDAIRMRKSVRTYVSRLVTGAVRVTIEESAKRHQAGPFGSAVRLALVDLQGVGTWERRRYGTYGVIQGARLFLLGAVREEARCMEDLGYCMEAVILEATALGLGSCWLAGTFRRNAFARKMGLSGNEILPVISPLGYDARKKTAMDWLMKAGSRSHRKKPWSDLFFHADASTPLTKVEAGKYGEPLEAVRLGPSAANLQPWRMVRDEDGLFHLYLKPNRLYGFLSKYSIQRIDMGIAMCHFSLVAREQGLQGRWEHYARRVVPGLEYVASWQPEN